MLVKDWMSRDVITVDASTSLQEAMKLLTEHNINMLPVMQDGKLVGVISDRDVKHAAPSEITVIDVKQITYHFSRLDVRAIMSPNPITVPEDFTLEETAEIFLDNNISGCPVLSRKGELVGIITKSDLFTALISATGMRKRGIRFGFLVEDKPGSIQEVADVLRSYGGKLASIMTTYEGSFRGHRLVYIRVYHLDRTKLPQILRELKAMVKVLYWIDHHTGYREVYATYGEAYV